MIHIFNRFVDMVFPPLCLACKERCDTKFLCPDCWQLCELPDPAERCRHCFEGLDSRGNLCGQCRKARILPVVRAYVFDPESPSYLLGLEGVDAMAGFAFLQWIQLEWPSPDVIVPMPDRDSVAIGRSLAQLIDCPFARALKGDCEYKEERLDEDLEVLLFDVSNSIERLQQASFALSESFPKRIRLVSLMPKISIASSS